MNDMKSYMSPIPVGDVMVGESVGEVVENWRHGPEPG
jgi:NADPH-dependent curcumin reductase CurA